MSWLSLLQTVLPPLVLALCVAVAAVFFWRLASETTGPFLAVAVPSPSAKGAWRAGAVCFAVCAGWLAVFAWRAAALSPGQPPEQALRGLFVNIDANSYLNLAQYGYGSGEAFPEQYLMIVFFPLFPWLVRGVAALTGLGFCCAGLAVQPFLFGGAGGLLYSLFARRFGPGTARWALAFLLVFPGAFFFAAPMTESLFLFLTALAFWLADRDRPLLFALAGCLAALTRSPGALLAGVAGVMFLQGLRAGAPRRAPRRALRWLAACLGPCAGLGCYLAINWHYYGDLFAYAAFQKQHWTQGLGMVWDTVRYHLSYLFSWWQDNRAFAVYISLLAVVYIFAQLALLLWAGRALPVPWLAYSLAYVLLTDGVTWLLSAPRYALCLPFLPLALALRLKKTGPRALSLAALAAASAWYFAAYCNTGAVY